MSEFVDLHCHSTASDGTLLPRDVVRLAKEGGLKGLALTDHDTIGGLAAAQAEAKALNLDFINGIEISAIYPATGTLHILGYGIDPENPLLKELTSGLVEGRSNRNPRIINRLQELGVAITLEELTKEANGAVQGRPHIAAILLRKGYVNSIKHAFDKYLGQDGLAYFDKERIEPRRALDLIDRSGGIAVLAHPIQLHTENDAQLERVVKDLVDLGLRGIEIIHSDHNNALIEKYSRLADRYSLLKTGGSDFHGTHKQNIELGKAAGRRIPNEWMQALQAAIDQRRATVAV